MKNYKIKIETQEFVIKEISQPNVVKLLAVKGQKGDSGEPGQDGYTPIKGVDYFTEEDIDSLHIPVKLSQLQNDTGYITGYTESDPVFNLSPAKNITTNDITNWNNKSDFSGSYDDLSNKPTLFSGDYNDLSNKPTIPSKTSELTNNSGFIDNTVNNLTNYTKTSSLSTVATSGSYNDLSNKPTIPDTSNMVTTNTTQDITSEKTIKSPLKIQNGNGTGSMWIGGDVNANTLRNNQRHLARIVVPSYSDVSVGATLLGFDSSGDNDMSVTNKSQDVVSFGGMKKITNATSPTAIGFCVAKTRGATASNDKVYPLELDSTEARFNVKPNYNGNDLALASQIPTNVSSLNNDSGYVASTSLSTVATSGDYDDLINKPTIPEKYDYIIPTFYIDTSDLLPGTISDSNIISTLSNIYSSASNSLRIGLFLYDEYDGNSFFVNNVGYEGTTQPLTFIFTYGSTYILDIYYSGGSTATYSLRRLEDISNKTTSLSSTSTHAQYPSAKAVVDYASPKISILKYGTSTWQDFINAYNSHAVIYCRASSNNNPASGSQTRMAFMAYVSDETNPTQVEFQYYRSVSSHSDSQQGDQVFVYLLKNTNGGTWSVTKREAFTKIVAGTGLTSSYSNGVLTISLS